MIYFITKNISIIDTYDSTRIQLSTIDYLNNWLSSVEIVGLDTETEGIFNFKNKVIMLQIGNYQDQFVIDMRNYTKEELINLGNFIENKEKVKILWNAKFDYKFLKYWYNWDINNLYDGFLAECILTNGLDDRKLSLEANTLKYCNFQLNKSIRSRFSSNEGVPFTNSEVIYGAKDTKYLIDIKKQQSIKQDEYQLHEVTKLENDVVASFVDMELNGWCFDKESWLKVANKAEKNLKVLEEDLDNLVLNEPKLKKFVKQYTQVSLFDIVERQISIMWSSPTQVAKVFKELGISLESTSEKEIAKYQNEYPLVKKFIDYKKEQKITTTYGKSFIKFVWPDGRIRTTFWQILETFRVSSGQRSIKTREEYPNLQNIPAKNEFLNCFIASKGNKIIGIDYAAQEARVAAFGSNEPIWINTFLEGKDLHSEVCKMMFNITDELVRTKPDFLRGKSYRDVAKTINFGALFGMSKFKLANTLQISVDEADVLLKKYFESVDKLKSYLKACANYGLKNGYIRSFKPISGIRWFPQWRNDLNTFNDYKLIGEIERASYNTPIQATAALITKTALTMIREDIVINNRPVKLLHAVHDAIYTECPETYSKEYSIIQDNLMKKAWNLFIPTLPIETDITITDYWSK